MIIYIYDGSFEGLLTSIYEAYYSSTKPDEIQSSLEYQPNLLTEPVYIETNEEKYNKVYDAIKHKISKDALNLIYHVYLSELKGSSTLIYKYIKLGFKLGSSVNLYLYNDTVLNINKISRKVILECQRMLGFIRFKVSGNIYYSAIEPDNNILSLIAPHFSSRLPNENWIIHDIKRKVAVFHNKKDCIMVPLSSKDAEKIFFDTDNYETLWKEYYKAATITTRLNPRLQNRLMPVRYRKHLTEFDKQQ